MIHCGYGLMWFASCVFGRMLFFDCSTCFCDGCSLLFTDDFLSLRLSPEMFGAFGVCYSSLAEGCGCCLLLIHGCLLFVGCCLVVVVLMWLLLPGMF